MAQMNQFVRQLLIAAKKQEEKEVSTPKHEAGAKKAPSEKLTEKIDHLEHEIDEFHSQDITAVEMLRNQIRGMEHELRITETRRSEEVQVNRLKIDQVRNAIEQVKDKIGRIIDERKEREKRFLQLEQKIKTEVRENKDTIEEIESELSELKSMETEDRMGFFEKLRAKLHKKKDLDDYVKPEEKELFAKELPKPRPIPKIYKRPIVKHELLIGEVDARPSIPKDEEKPDLPPLPKPPMREPPSKVVAEEKPMPTPPAPDPLLVSIPEQKPGLMDKIKNFFRKKQENI